MTDRKSNPVPPAATPEIWPGPMEGVGRADFVRAVNRLRLVDRWLTPFWRVSGAGTPRPRQAAEFLAPFLEGGVPVTLQLLGDDPAALAAAAVEFRRQGAAGIDLNCGCPSRRVVGHRGGGDLLRRPETIVAILSELRDALGGGVPLSCKLRCGFAAPEEIEPLLGRLAGSGLLSRLFLHFRTVQEGYSAVPDRAGRLARAVRAAAGLPVVVNGDIADADEGWKLAAETGAAGVMAARGWLRDPWLLRRLAEPERRDFPAPAEARELFYAEVRRAGAVGGHAVEIAKMLWGADSPRFRAEVAAIGSPR